MGGFTSIIGDWHLYVLLVGYWALSNAISALAMPDTNSSAFYAWFFKFANGFAANFSRAFAGKIPGTSDAMPLAGSQELVNKAAVVAKAADIIEGTK